MKCFIKGTRSEVQLEKRHYRTSGGEGDIYVKGDTVYKVCFDGKMIPEGKFRELSVLNNPRIIKPDNILIDSKNVPIGYTMRYVEDTVNLCQLFPKPFRTRNHITNDMMLHLIRQMQHTIQEIHKNKILIVDLNELNFLVNDKYNEVYFIDVNSYQTPTYPALAIMDSIRDRHAKEFTEASDWFSFAIISFQMFIGMHPFKGTHPRYTDKKTAMEERMKHNISVLNPDASYPKAACQDIRIIPPAYLDWYYNLFEKGKRLPPPSDLTATINVIAPVKIRVVGNKVEVTRLKEYDSNILGVCVDVVRTEKSIYYKNRPHSYKNRKMELAFTNIPLGVYLENKQLHIVELLSLKEIVFPMTVNQFMVNEGRIYVQNNDQVLELLSINGNLTSQVVGHVMGNATQFFDGVVIQNLFGTLVLSCFPKSKQCFQVPVKELSGHKIVNAKMIKNVLVCVTFHEGKYHRHVIRMNDTYEKYHLRTVNDVQTPTINFVLLDNGTCVLINDIDEIELFRSDRTSVDVKVVQDPCIEQDMNLFVQGNQVCYFDNESIYSLKMKP